MRKSEFISTLAIAAMIGTVGTIPVFAVETATGGTEVTYTANSAAPDAADWMVSYPKKVVLTDYNTTEATGVSLDFALLDKMTSAAYAGAVDVDISVETYATGISMSGGTGTAIMGIADDQLTELAAPNFTVGTMNATGNTSSGKAYLKSTANPEGTFSANVTFTFTDNSTN